MSGSGSSINLYPGTVNTYSNVSLVQAEPTVSAKLVGGSLERVKNATVNLHALSSQALADMEDKWQVSHVHAYLQRQSKQLTCARFGVIIDRLQPRSIKWPANVL